MTTILLSELYQVDQVVYGIGVLLVVTPGPACIFPSDMWVSRPSWTPSHVGGGVVIGVVVVEVVVVGVVVVVVVVGVVVVDVVVGVVVVLVVVGVVVVVVAVSYTHLRAHETPEHLVCRLLLEKKKKTTDSPLYSHSRPHPRK
eukprot:TRINITY_DN46950_c0_g2_i2.p2 TRINITY_DN46950_c0_g2~~TRINITY_DN46950_c0_g2_i2.p2  ORF type:complete len:143 (-),score=27.76 TRINITY_DN46950_c0_g2_i2:20-448(-)